MAKIHELATVLADQIAAGEVVEKASLSGQRVGRKCDRC